MASLRQFDPRQTGESIALEAVFDDVSGAWKSWQRPVKRTIDILGAAVFLVLCAPVMALIALVIRLDSPGPIIYRQVRVGKNGRSFVFLKFRSMFCDAEERLEELQAMNEAQGPLFKIRRDPRVTRVGRLLRRSSLDELPQLWNVLRGDMSLVGPRPPLPSEVERYEPWQRSRLSVTPGLTGLWQVNGRSTLDFAAMVQLDLEYIEHWSVLLDLKILLQTVPVVFLASGGY